MRHVRVDYPPAGAPPRQQMQRQARSTPRCARHPGVHMVLAGTNMQWNTVRYICPMCDAMGLPPVEVATGVVSGYWPQRGYGFIDNGGPRIFFHVSDLTGQFTPYVGMPVTCQVEQNAKGLVARQVGAH
ncbi:MAG: cold shock domain-containing protein [Anaerolineae bacterium]|nr:cold shock domain-containing protein [Anaerolineae bacterium]